MKHVIGKVLLITSLIALVACGKPSLEGTYVDDKGKDAMTFTADGMVRVGNRPETKYTLEGDSLKFDFGGVVPFDGKVAPNGVITFAAWRFTKK